MEKENTKNIYANKLFEKMIYESSKNILKDIKIKIINNYN